MVDYDLLAAMAQLGPGDNHELQPSKCVTIHGQELATPSIVVHVCEGGMVGTLTCWLYVLSPRWAGARARYSKLRCRPG